MAATIELVTTKHRSEGNGPSYVIHPSFTDTTAATLFGPVREDIRDENNSHMLDEVTRDRAQRMHYAAYRADHSVAKRTKDRWHAAYLSFRDQIVVGNRKLIYRAVRRWMPPSAYADDMVGDCHIVLIQAVAAYNPWIGIRFSTYAFTCLMRALSRLSQRHAADRLAHSVPLDALPHGEPPDWTTEELPQVRLQRIDEFLREGNELLSAREKMVLSRRFSLDDRAASGTLEQVGKELGLSKERVRQVQASALGKLRKALAEPGVV